MTSFAQGGPNLISSFHVIGEIFDLVYDKRTFDAPMRNVQTTAVLPGGATVVEFTVDVPDTYLLVDHALGRALKGGAGHLIVSGPEDPAIFNPLEASHATDGEPTTATSSHAEADADVDRTVTVVMTKFAYEPDESPVELGETVRLVPVNEGGILHDITADGFRGDAHAVEGGLQAHDNDFHVAANAGLQSDLIFTAEEVGRFDLFCSVPGHRDLGMTATLVVTA